MIRITPMPAGMQGQAEFSKETPPLCRYTLDRRWGPSSDYRYLLWIGHNPSQANHLYNDPTVDKECKFTKALGYRGYKKLNIMDRIGTEPRDLLTLDGVCSANNKLRILLAARKAEKIICCWGAVHPRLKIFAETTEHMLRAEGFALWTLCLNADGSPRHSLYIHGDTKLMPYEGKTQ